MKSVKQLLEDEVNRETKEFNWGVDTVMRSIRPNCLFKMRVTGGRFIITEWEKNWDGEKEQYIEKPTEEEIRTEYNRQQNIAECIDYFKSKNSVLN